MKSLACLKVDTKKITRLAAAGAIAGSIFMTFLAASSAQANWQSNPPGETEIIDCIKVAGAFDPIHWWNSWSSPSWSWFDSSSLGGDPYWNYASPNKSGWCDNWVNGSIGGGATYSPPSAAVRTGKGAHVTAMWYDYSFPDFSNKGQCGHQHVSEYIWGWRYLGGSSWTVEYVDMTALSTHWNDSTARCEFQGTGAPGYANFPQFAYGNGTIDINNSPYAVLYVKSRAQSHGGGPCGAPGCFHPVLTLANYY